MKKLNQFFGKAAGIAKIADLFLARVLELACLSGRMGGMINQR
jgi:hypothetical protein